MERNKLMLTLNRNVVLHRMLGSKREGILWKIQHNAFNRGGYPALVICNAFNNHRVNLVHPDNVGVSTLLTIRSKDGQSVLVHEFPGNKPHSKRLSIAATPGESADLTKDIKVSDLLLESVSSNLAEFLTIDGQRIDDTPYPTTDPQGEIVPDRYTFINHPDWELTYDGLSYLSSHTPPSSVGIHYTLWVDGEQPFEWRVGIWAGTKLVWHSVDAVCNMPPDTFPRHDKPALASF